MSRTRLRRVLGGAASAGPVACAIAWVTAPLTWTGYNPWRQDLSTLSTLAAPWPWITVSGELLLSVGILGLATGLAITLAGRDVLVGVAMLVTTGLAIAAQAVAREDCDTGLAACAAREEAGLVSWHHSLHGYAAVLSFVTVLAAPIVLARPFRSQPAWHNLAAYSVGTTVAGLILLVAYVAVPDTWTGLAQRLFVTVPVAWTAVVGARLVRLPGAGTPFGVRTTDPVGDESAIRPADRRRRHHGPA